MSGIPWLRYSLEVNTINSSERFYFSTVLKEILNNQYSRIFASICSTLLLLVGILKNSNTDMPKFLIFLVPFSGVFMSRFISWIFLTSRAEISDSMEVNQGIKNSLKNIKSFVFFVVFLFAMLTFRLSLGLTSFLEKELLFLVLISYLTYIVIAALLEGGRPLFQHFILRVVLASNNYAPFRYDLLLNYCTERLLLQRIGGRYRFMHKLLQDHFAAMDLE